MDLVEEEMLLGVFVVDLDDTADSLSMVARNNRWRASVIYLQLFRSQEILGRTLKTPHGLMATLEVQFVVDRDDHEGHIFSSVRSRLSVLRCIEKQSQISNLLKHSVSSDYILHFSANF